MSDPGDWQVPEAAQPKAAELGFNLDRTLSSVVSLRAEIPEDAFTADILGTEREGNGVVIGDDGLVLTIGYLITEAATVWLVTEQGTAAPAHVVGYDQKTNFGLVQALGRLDLPAIALGRSDGLKVGDEVIVAG
jgi:S1-C subfamily serine protease